MTGDLATCSATCCPDLATGWRRGTFLPEWLPACDAHRAEYELAA